MSRGLKRKRIRNKPSVQLKLKFTTRVAVATSITAILLSIGIFLYINFTQVAHTKAASNERIIEITMPKSEIEVKSTVQLPMEKQPAPAKNPGIENKRKAVLLQHE